DHFWHCLYLSGELTSTLLLQSEENSLSGRYNFGLTNIVDRPSAEVSATPSRVPMDAVVPAFLSKISHYSPFFVCFVGVGIWTVIRKASQQLQRPSGSTTSGSQDRWPEHKCARKNSLGLQSYKLLHPAKAARRLCFVVPSTSRRVVRYQVRKDRSA
ncbi:hypothetical protein F5141DRAFT_998944, partial [Pisolithus sp. B1]